MKNRFDLENDINFFSDYSEQIRLIARGYSGGQLTDDELLNALEGVAVLLELQREKTFDSFKQIFSLDEYRVEDNLEEAENDF